MTLDELKTLLTLNGNQRLTHLESEIFSDVALYSQYLISLNWNTGFRYYDLPMMTYYYTIYIIGTRWAEAEGLIAKDRYCANWYNSKFETNI